MADRALTLREGFLQISLQLDGLAGENFLDVIGVTIFVLAIGFVFGYWYASKGRIVAVMCDKGSAGEERGILTSGSRTVGTQSQCTYKWKNITPRFQVLPQMSDGVFYPDIEMNYVD